MKRRKTILLLAAALFAAGAVQAQTVTVDLSDEKQTIRGFGGMNHVAWRPDLTDEHKEKVFGNAPDQLGLSILRIHVDPNSNSWTRSVATAKYASDRGLYVFASPWTQPADMMRQGQSRYNASTEFNNVNLIRTNRFAQYVGHLNSFVDYMTGQGVNLYAVSVQNEHDYGYHGGWTEWTGQEILTFMKDHAGNIDKRVKVMTPEPFQYRKNELDMILNDAAALANTDIVATHLYGTQPSAFAYPAYQQRGAGKELWMTEVYHPNSSDTANLWPQALEVATHIHRSMVDGGFQAYVWWYIQRYYSLIMEPENGGAITKRGWMMGHFSKFVRPGYVRVSATPAMPVEQSGTGHGTGGVFVSAYKGGDSAAVIVAVNRGTSAANLNLTINGGAARTVTVERYRTTGTDNMARLQDAEVNGAGFDISLPAQSVTTYIIRYKATTNITRDAKNTRHNNVSSLMTLKGNILTVNESPDTKVKIRVVNLSGKTAARFNVYGGSKISLTKIPAGMYIVEAARVTDGIKTASNIVLR